MAKNNGFKELIKRSFLLRRHQRKAIPTGQSIHSDAAYDCLYNSILDNQVQSIFYECDDEQ